MRLARAAVYPHSAPRFQLSVSAGNRWPHNALQSHENRQPTVS